MSLDLIVTNAGRAALVNAANNGTLPVTIAEIGLSAVNVVPDSGMETLAGEFARLGAIAGEVVADDTIHVTLRDEGTGAYTVRSLALYLADGTVFAIYGQVDPIIVKTSGSVALLALDVIFADIGAAELAFGDTDFALPTATTARQGIVELATLAEAKAGTDALRALTPAAAKSAVLQWLLTQDGAGSLLDADKLDGQEGAWYANIPARLGYAPLDAALFTPAIILAMLLTVDGPASGLDADRLDGRHGADYLRVTSSSQSENGGYRIYSDGFRECWGKAVVPQDAQNFAINFPAACRFTSFSNVSVSGARAGEQQDNDPNVASTSLNGFTVHSSADSSVTIWWHARGY